MTEKVNVLAFKIPGRPPEPYACELRRLAAKWEEERIEELERGAVSVIHKRLSPWLKLMERVIESAPNKIEARLFCERLLEQAMARAETPERLERYWNRRKKTGLPGRAAVASSLRLVAG